MDAPRLNVPFRTKRRGSIHKRHAASRLGGNGGCQQYSLSKKRGVNAAA